MRNLKKLFLTTGAGAVVAVMALTGCEMMNHSSQSGERTAGRTLDDKTITENVKHGLDREPVYKFSDVDVKTFNGVVELSGFVTTDDQKTRAAQIAQQVPGVAQVVNSIALKSAGNLAPTGAAQPR